MIEVFQQALMVTGFVFVMMLVIEYLNVLTAGGADKILKKSRWGQSFFTSFLGATPGCLGAYAVGSFYIHRIVTFGALSAAMVATCGDEAFLMLSLFPQKALLIFLVLFATGIVTGVVVDLVMKGRTMGLNSDLDDYKAVHHDEARCIPFSRAEFIQQWKACTPHRGILTFVLALFVAGVATGAIGHHHLGSDAAAHEHHEHSSVVASDDSAEEGEGWGWVRVTLLLVGLVGLFIVVTVPEHFLEEHFWHHLVKVHLWRMFVWILGAMVLSHLLLLFVDIHELVEHNALPVILLACLIGLIPQSGPHIVFVTLYAEGSIPFSILLANCIVQDGHGLVPVLSHSRKAFLAIKAGKFVLGITVGLVAYWFGC